VPVKKKPSEPKPWPVSAASTRMQNFDLTADAFEQFESVRLRGRRIVLTAENRERLCEALRWAEWRLFHDSTQPSVDEVQPLVTDLAKTAAKLRDMFSTISVVADGQSQGRRSLVHMAVANSLKHVMREKAGNWGAEIDLHEWDAAFRYIAEIAEAARRLRPSKVGAPRSIDAVRGLILDLASIYEDATGHELRTGINTPSGNGPKVPTGPFLRFVRTAISLFGETSPYLSDSVLGSRIRATLAERKHRRAAQPTQHPPPIPNIAKIDG
jgi:hypothetical protein